MALRRLGDVLVASGAVTRARVEAVAAAAATKKLRLGSALLHAGVVNERDVGQALAVAGGHPVVDLGGSTLDLELLSLLPDSVAREHTVLPIATRGEVVTVVAADVGARPVFSKLELALGKKVRPLLGVRGQIASAIEAAYLARATGSMVLVGRRSPSATPYLEVLRAPPAKGENKVSVLVNELAGPFASLRRVASKATAARPAAPAPSPSVTTSTPQAAASPPAASSAPPPTAIPAPLVAPPQLPFELPGGDGPLAVIIEDDSSIREMMSAALRHDGCRVIEVDRGDEALKILRAARPSLVVLDAMLPGLHGFEICRRLKQHPVLKVIPVLVVSAVHRGWESSRDIREVHGADAFLEKPFTTSMLRKLVGNLLGREVVLEPAPPELLDELAAMQRELEARRQEGSLAAAEAVVARWLALAPFDAIGHLEAGNLHIEQSRFEEALNAYQHATTLDPLLFSAWANLAQVYERLGFARTAAITWEKAALLAPETATRQHIEQHLKAPVPPPPA